MSQKSNIFEGKTTNEAIEKALKELNVSKSKVDIKVLEAEDKRSFFSILTPRIVKVEVKLKEGVEKTKATPKEKELKSEPKKEKKQVSEKTDINSTISNIKNFLKDFIKHLPTPKLEYMVTELEGNINVEINGDDTGYLIGYRGEVLNSLQTILTSIATRNSQENIKVLLNISGYRQKREKDLQSLATKIASSVIKTKKSITLEPMSAYERKVIHTKLQENDKVETYSIGEDPYRKIVVKLK